jgi:hypothetical protein
LSVTDTRTLLISRPQPSVSESMRKSLASGLTVPLRELRGHYSGKEHVMSNLEEEGQGGAAEEGGMAGGTEDEGGMGGGSEGGMGDQPGDVGGWEDNEPSTHAGEGGQSDDVA